MRGTGSALKSTHEQRRRPNRPLVHNAVGYTGAGGFPKLVLLVPKKLWKAGLEKRGKFCVRCYPKCYPAASAIFYLIL